MRKTRNRAVCAPFLHAHVDAEHLAGTVIFCNDLFVQNGLVINRNAGVYSKIGLVGHWCTSMRLCPLLFPDALGS